MQFESLGPYKIVKRIGQGGMGEVYEGVDAQTKRRVAIKVLNPALATAEGFRDRFEAEIESLRKLRHPNIVHMYGYGEQAGFLFYSMEMVDGRNVEDEMASGRRFTWREITAVGIKLCKALKHAHDHGVIHRDLKPANLLLTEDDDVKLLDFGIARLFGNSQLTSAGGVLGTADYMSPEQADGRPVTDRCDQYSLGCVLYAMATGKPPFHSNSLPELLQLQRFAEPEPVRRYAPQVPEELERIILQLLEKDPEKRFPNTKVLARRMAAMERALSLPLADDGFQLTGHAVDALPDVEPSPGTTRVPTDLVAGPQSRDPEPQELYVESTAPTGVYSVLSDAVVPPVPRPAETRFTTIEEEVRREQLLQAESWAAVALRSVALVGVVVMFLVGGWYFLRPPSADALYAAIRAAAQDSREESLLDVEQEISTFLARFPADGRSNEVRQYQEEVELMRTGRSLFALARRRGQRDGLAPVQRMYVEAIRQKDENPERAIADLQALIDLYDDDADEPTQQCLTLARRQLERIGEQVYRYAPDQLKSIEQRLQRAEQIQASDPQRARQIWRAIIKLCRDKPWAHEVVGEAETALKASQAVQTREVAPKTNDEPFTAGKSGEESAGEGSKPLEVGADLSRGDLP